MRLPPVRRVWLCLPPLTAFILDLTFTLHGQRPEYWAGDYSAVDEGNPVASWVMQIHPLLFLTCCFLYAAVLGLLLSCWRSSATVVLSFLLTLSHSVGAG